MDMVFILIAMEMFMMENIKMIMLKDMAFFIIKMEIKMKESSKMEDQLEFM